MFGEGSAFVVSILIGSAYGDKFHGWKPVKAGVARRYA